MKCQVCGKELKKITWTHLKKHRLTPEEYKKKYGVNNLFSKKSREELSKAHKGKKLSKEHKKKLSEAHKGEKFSEERKAKISKALKGRERDFSEEHKAKISEALKGREFSEEHKENLSKAGEGREFSEETKLKISNTLKGREFPEEWKAKLSEALENPSEEKREKARKGAIQAYKNGKYNKRPTSIEKQFMEICDRHDLPFKYVGDGQFWIEGMNPDFVNVNGRKVAIEILGDYWHNEDEFRKRKGKFSKYGWKCIGIWGHELEELTEEEIVKRVGEGL